MSAPTTKVASGNGADGVPSAAAAVEHTLLVVIGASGDLAHKKTYPSIYELFVSGLLPERSTIVGYARSTMPDDAFRTTISKYLTAGTDTQRAAFLARCFYRHGGYDDAAAFKRVRCRLAGESQRHQDRGTSNAE